MHLNFLRTALLCIATYTISISSASGQFKDGRDSMLSHFAEAKSDSIARTYSPSIGDLGIQFVSGQLGYAIPFWALGGYNFIKRGEFIYAFGHLLGYVTAPIAINLATDAISPNRGNTAVGIVGSVMGGLLLTLVMQEYIIPKPRSIFSSYLCLSLPPVVSGLIFYDLPIWLSSGDAEN